MTFAPSANDAPSKTMMRAIAHEGVIYTIAYRDDIHRYAVISEGAGRSLQTVLTPHTIESPALSGLFV